MGTDVFDPDNETVADFCQDVLGLPPVETTVAQAAPSSLKSFGSFFMGVFFGLALGFTLGTWRVPALVMEACK